VERKVYSLLKYGFRVAFISKVMERRCLVFDRSFSDLNCIDVEIDRSVYLLLESGLSRTMKRVKYVLDNVRPDMVIAINP